MKTISGPMLWLLLAPPALGLVAVPAQATTTLDREFRYEASRFRLVLNADGTTDVRMPGVDRELRPGRPEMPVSGERVELPVGARLASVQVLEVSTVPLAHGVRLPSTPRLEPGIDRLERTAPDPAWFGGDRFVPDPLAVPGYEGFERGRNVATIAVAPVRWNPATGELERVERIRLRLVLEDTPDRPLLRERVVPDWEEGAVTRAARPTRLGAARVAEPFQATQIPSLLGSPVAYVVVTSDALAPAFQRLADWKTQSGVPAVVRTMSFIREQYPGGTDDAERVRMFLKDAYTRWGTKWVLIGGDTDVIPVRLGRTTYYNGEWIATDLYYSCLDGNWDGDGDSIFGEGVVPPSNPGDQADLLPEVYVGRAPASTLAEAQLFVDKSLSYERDPVPDYMTNMLTFAEVLFPQDWQPGQQTSLDGAELIDYDLLPITDTAPQIHVARLYENHTDPRWRPGSLLETKAVVLDSLNAGYNISIHVGHGYRNVMHVGDTDLQNTDVQALTNGSRQTNLYAIDCSSTSIDYASITEAMMKNPNGGAVTVVGSTRYDFPAYGRQYQQTYFQLLYQQGVNAIGELQARQKLPYVAYSNSDGPHRWTQMTLVLLGDPELRLFTTAPRTLAVTHPASLAVSDSTFTVHVETGGAPLDSAIVTLYRADDEYVSARTYAGDVTLPVRPDSVGAMTLTVTGYNCRPYQATVALVAGGAPALAERAIRLLDDGSAGSSGNANGLWDAGETIAIAPVLRNNGGAAAGSVTAILSSTDGLVTVPGPTASYGTIAAGDSAAPSPWFRVQIPYTAGDQREVPFTIRLSDGSGRTYLEHFSLTLRAPELLHVSHLVIDDGDHNGIPDPGETVYYYVRLRNVGTGVIGGLTAKLRSVDGGATVIDSIASWAMDLGPGEEQQGDAFRFTVLSDTTKLLLIASDARGERFRQTLDVRYPFPASFLMGTGGPTGVSLTWTKPPTTDLRGYNVYRSSSSTGPWTKVTPVPTGRIAYYYDGGLTPLTRYYHQVSAVDSSGNESDRTPVVSTSTNPPLHGMFPIPTGRTSPAPIALDHVYPEFGQDIIAGSDYLYLWHPDGTTPVDADGSGATSGDFTKMGSYYAAGPSVADIDGGDKEVIGSTWNGNDGTGAGRVCVFDLAGASKPGWPFQALDNLWSAVAVGDLFGDGQKELVFSSNGNRFYALRANGTEVRDGDSNPATAGVFKVLGNSFNYGSPAIAPLQNDGTRAIVYASSDGKVYAWRPDGSNVPGFPFTMSIGTPASVAVGSLDGPGGPLSIAVPSIGDSLYVLTADGKRRPGFPVRVRLEGSTGKIPSPALADMNGDGYLDVVQAATDGTLWVYDRNGSVVPPWSGVRYSVVLSQCTESSPVVADINGDGHPDVLIGDEMGQLTCLSGADGSVLAGFPIQLGGEVRGTPAVGDIDGDGMTEIALTDWDKNVYIWDYDFPFSPGVTPPWPQFHHDAARTGYAGTPMYVDVPAAGGAAPRALELALPAPNPARATTRLWYAVPSTGAGGALDLAIYDLSGRRVRTIESGRAEPGRHSAEWDLRDSGGTPARAGIYFVRLVLGAEAHARKIVVVR